MLDAAALDAAACAQLPLAVSDALFFSDAPESIRQARRICAGCPISDLCLSDALKEEAGMSAYSRAGIRAGHTPAQRAAAERAADGRYVAAGVTHGTRYAYAYGKCRCEDCTAANAAYQLAHRRRRREVSA